MTTMTRHSAAGPMLLAILLAGVVLLLALVNIPIPETTRPEEARVADAAPTAPMLTATERQSAETLAGLMAPSGQVTVHIPGIGPTVWGQHAESRHGMDAWKAIAAAAACGERCLYHCPNGKVYSVGWLDAGHSFLVVLVETTGVTAFMSNHDLSYRPQEEGCSSATGRLAGHDGFGPGMAY